VEKLLIFYVITKQINLEDVTLSHVSNPLSFKILKTILRLARREEDIPTFEGLRLLFKESEHKSEALKLSAYLDVCESSDTSISPDEVIKSLKTSYALTQVESSIAEIAESAINKDLESLSISVKQLQDNVDGTMERKAIMLGEVINEEIASIPSFVDTLNIMGNPLTGLVLITGESGLGKSSYCVSECANALIKKEDATFFSLEMPARLLENRFMSNLGEIPFKELMDDSYTGKGHVPLRQEHSVTRERIRKAFREGNVYGNLHIYTDIFDADEILANIKRLARQGVKLFVIDYLGLCTFAGASLNSWAELKRFTIQLNRVCMELGIVVLLPTQSTLEKSPNGQLTFTSAGTKELKNSATLALLLYQSVEAKEAGLIELHVAKTRNGRHCIVALEARLDIGRFNDLGLLE